MKRREVDDKPLSIGNAPVPTFHTLSMPRGRTDSGRAIRPVIEICEASDEKTDPDMRRSVAKAIFDSIEFGHRHDIGQLGPMGRCYQFRRRSGALSIRVGQGKEELSLPVALRLATALDSGDRHREPETEAA
jgi:hypothetical protein